MSNRHAPFVQHQMRSACSTLETRWAMMILVVPGMCSANAWRILLSVAVSTALVESSRINSLGFFQRALAMHRRCFCPPETLEPPRSMWVSYPSGRRLMNSSAQAGR